MRSRFTTVILFLCLAHPSLAPRPAVAGEVVAGPVAARVLRVIDGDTIEAEAAVWPGHSVRVSIRIRGIDAPEMRSGCDTEKAAALIAREVLADLLSAGAVEVRNVGPDKYFGRVVADVTSPDGGDVGSTLVARAVAREYGGGARPRFCED
jgi:micrococcal nuclease